MFANIWSNLLILSHSLCVCVWCMISTPLIDVISSVTIFNVVSTSSVLKTYWFFFISLNPRSFSDYMLSSFINKTVDFNCFVSCFKVLGWSVCLRAHRNGFYRFLVNATCTVTKNIDIIISCNGNWRKVVKLPVVHCIF